MKSHRVSVITGSTLALGLAWLPVYQVSAATADTTPPVVTNVQLPQGTSTNKFFAASTISDPDSGVNKAYLYIDRPDGKNVQGIRLFDDGTNGDLQANDSIFSANVIGNVPPGTYDVSILTYDSKYNQVQPKVATLTVAADGVWTWTPVSGTSPSPSPTATSPASPTPTPTSTPTASPTPTAPSGTLPATGPGPSVSDLVMPTGTTSGTVTFSARVVDSGSGVRKTYLYIDRPAPSGRNVSGQIMWDDATHGDAKANDDRYTLTTTLSIPDGTYDVSILALNGKYDENKPRIATLTVSGGNYTWAPVGTTNPTPTPTTTPTPTPTPTQTVTPTPTPTTPTQDPTPTTPTYPPAGTNLVTNGDFENGLVGWSNPSGSAAVTNAAYQGSKAAALTSTASTTARIQQTLTGLKPKTMYTFAVRLKTTGSQPSDVWGSFAVTDGAQRDKTNSQQSPDWVERRFIFYTAADSTSVTLKLDAGNNNPPGTAFFDDVRVVEGTMPAPTPDPGQPAFDTPPVVPILPMPGGNLITNGDFTGGNAGWTVDGANVISDGGNNVMTVTSTDTKTARAVQNIYPLLAPNTTYTLTGRAKVSHGSATVNYASSDGKVTATKTVTSPDWQQFSVPFTTPATYISGKVSLENWKGGDGTLSVDDLKIIAQGGEWLDTPNPTPTPQPPLVADFSNTSHLDSSKWLIANKGWGGDNGGVVPANVHFADGALQLEAHGDQYTGPVKGVDGKRNTRVGAAIVSRDYYASGRYDVVAKVPKQLGACTAFWTFHYIEETPSQPDYWNEPNRIRNSEIDWEMPTSLGNGSSPDPISFSNARANAWGGKWGGEGGESSQRVALGNIIGDGQYHTYSIEWHSGGNGILPHITWLVDGKQVQQLDGSDFGQDNIPFRASRFWIGIWFPASGYLGQTGWAGNPDFDTTRLSIKSVSITPFNEPNDRYEAETWPDGFYANPSQYP